MPQATEENSRKQAQKAQKERTLKRRKGHENEAKTESRNSRNRAQGTQKSEFRLGAAPFRQPAESSYLEAKDVAAGVKDELDIFPSTTIPNSEDYPNSFAL